jgi:ankyrin repeat protein
MHATNMNKALMSWTFFCRDPQVSVQAIELLVKQHAPQAATQNAQGLYPFQVAFESGARLDVIFYLLKHSPDALENARTPPPPKKKPKCVSAIDNERWSPLIATVDPPPVVGTEISPMTTAL